MYVCMQRAKASLEYQSLTLFNIIIVVVIIYYYYY